jgi:hypothetical protein
MRRMNRKLMSYFVAIMLAVTSTVYVSGANAAYYDQEAEKPTAGTMLADTVMVRLPMLAATAVGAVTFVVTLPFSALGGNVGEAGRILVVDPAKYTFVRPLGVF